MYLPALILVALILTGCSETAPDNPDRPATTVENLAVSPVDAATVATAFRTNSKAANLELLTEIGALMPSLEKFLAAPSEANLQNLQDRWLSAHLAYSRAHFGLLTNRDTDPDLLFRIDAWPIQPGFIDNLEGYPESGIVFDETLEITSANLLVQHGITDREEVVLGFHALELLLFTRSVSDFEAGTSVFHDRRRNLLQLIGQQLIEDVELLVAESDQNVSGLDPVALLERLLALSLSKSRGMLTESNLIAAEDSGHSLDKSRSLQILSVELDSMKRFLLTPVALAALFQPADPVNHKNFVQTIERGIQITEEARAAATSEGSEQLPEDSLALAELPLILSALTHQLEAFTQPN